MLKRLLKRVVFELLYEVIELAEKEAFEIPNVDKDKMKIILEIVKQVIKKIEAEL